MNYKSKSRQQSKEEKAFNEGYQEGLRKGKVGRDNLDRFYEADTYDKWLKSVSNKVRNYPKVPKKYKSDDTLIRAAIENSPREADYILYDLPMDLDWLPYLYLIVDVMHEAKREIDFKRKHRLHAVLSDQDRKDLADYMLEIGVPARDVLTVFIEYDEKYNSVHHPLFDIYFEKLFKKDSSIIGELGVDHHLFPKYARLAIEDDPENLDEFVSSLVYTDLNGFLDLIYLALDLDPKMIGGGLRKFMREPWFEDLAFRALSNMKATNPRYFKDHISYFQNAEAPWIDRVEDRLEDV